MKFNNWNLNHEIQLKFKLWNSMSLNFKVKQFNMTFNANLNYEIQSRCTNTEDTTQQHDHVHRHKNAHRQWHCTSTQKYISTQNVFSQPIWNTQCASCASQSGLFRIWLSRFIRTLIRLLASFLLVLISQHPLQLTSCETCTYKFK